MSDATWKKVCLVALTGSVIAELLLSKGIDWFLFLPPIVLAVLIIGSLVRMTMKEKSPQ